MNFGPKLKALRDSHHLSQTPVAHFLGIDQSTYSKWESGEVKNLPFEAMVKLADLYKMDKLDMISYLNDEKTMFYNHHQ